MVITETGRVNVFDWTEMVQNGANWRVLSTQQ